MTVSILETEIRQQPDVLAALVRQPVFAEVAAAIRKAAPKYVLIAARGTSDNAARYAQYLMGVHLGMPVALAAPSITTLYGQPLNCEGALVIGISQSGSGSDITQVISDATSQNALTIAITNIPDSPLAKASKFCLPLGAGPERSVAATKTYTAQLGAIAALVSHWAQNVEHIAALEKLPEWVNAVLESTGDISDHAERFRFMTRCAVLGRGYNYSTAFEIALKTTELTYTLAEPYSSADFRHGPRALLEADFPTIAIAPSGEVFGDMLNLIHEIRERGADLTVISDKEEALEAATFPIRLPGGVPEWLSPIVSIVPGQWLAMRIAHAKGLALDTPRNLSKVTITR